MLQRGCFFSVKIRSFHRDAENLNHSQEVPVAFHGLNKEEKWAPNKET